MKKYMYERKGFNEALAILYKYENMLGKDFLREFLENGGDYYNAWYRMEKYMKKQGLINIEKGRISITDKGKDTFLLKERLHNLIEGGKL